MDVGTTVYFLWYDFFLECERMMQGVVEDNSLWADHPRNSQLVNVRFHMPGVHGTVCHHFPASRLCTDSVRALQECPHDDCYLVCGKISENVPKIAENVPKIAENFPKSSLFVPTKPDNDVLPSDVRTQLEAFKRENWDHQHNHLRVDKLEEFYQLWRMFMVPFGYVEAKPAKCGFTPAVVPAASPAVASSPNKPTPPTTPTPPKRKKKQQTNVIQLSLF